MGKGLEITEISIHPVRSGDSQVAAFAKIVFNDQFVVQSIRIVKGKFGPFISFPREYNKAEGKGYNLCYPITKSFQEYISRRILEEYGKAMEHG